MELTPQIKRLFSEIINNNDNNKAEYLISTKNLVLIFTEGKTEAWCVKKVESDWESRYVDKKKALNLIGLDTFANEDEVDEDDEVEEVDEVDEDGILYYLIKFKFIIVYKYIFIYRKRY
jgi:hypothetical protein